MEGVNRRFFLLGSVAAGVVGGAAASDMKPLRARAVGEKPTVALIGMGRQMMGVLLGQFLGQDVLIVAVCDCDRARRENAARKINDVYKARKLGEICRAEADWRKIVADPGIDMVCVATPDHWHATITVAALKAGKDVYCEKPLTYNIDEAKRVMAASAKYGRIVQCGAMQRSSVEFRSACEIVRNGLIGEVKECDCSFGGPSGPHRFFDKPADAAKEGAPNPDVDWDMWLGPSIYTPYSDQLSPRGPCKTYPMFWRYDDYFGSGACGDWGAHHLDIAQWGLDKDGESPVKVVASTAPHSADPKHGGRRQCGLTIVYGDGKRINHVPGGWFSTVFYGTDGIVACARNRFALWLGKGVAPDATVRKAISEGTFDGMRKIGFWNVNPWSLKNNPKYKIAPACDKSMLDALNKGIKAVDLKNAKLKLYKTAAGHVDDFVKCFHSRQQPCSCAEVGCHSAILCQMCNTSYMYDSGFDWDPATDTFANGTGDPHWLGRQYFRNGWEIGC